MYLSNLSTKVQPSSFPQLIIIIYSYSFQHLAENSSGSHLLIESGEAITD